MCDVLVRTGPALILRYEQQFGCAPGEAEVTEIVDVVLLPALGVHD